MRSLFQDRTTAAVGAPATGLVPAADPEVVIRQAHARQRRRQRRIATVVLAVAAVAGAAVYLAMPGGLPRRAGTQNPDLGLASGPGGVPPYYAALSAPTRYRSRHPLNVTIRLTATSRVLVTIRPPTPGNTFSAVVGAGDDRTFVLAENHWFANSWNPLNGRAPRYPVSFYLLRFRPATDTYRLARLWFTLPAKGQVQGLALTPDGARIAVARGGNVITVFSLVKPGAERTWSARGRGVGGAQMSELSWTADGRYLGFNAFNWLARAPGLNVLDTAQPGGSLLASSRLLLRFGSPQMGEPTGPRCVGAGGGSGALLSPDGRIIACALVRYARNTQQRQRGGPPWLPRRDGYGDYSAGTGRLLRQVGISYNRGSYPDLLWISPSGNLLIAQPEGPNGPAVIIGPRRTIVLPWPWVVYGAASTVPGYLAAW